MRRIIDENGRLFGKISFIDIIVLIAVAAVVITLVRKPEVIIQTSGGVATQPVEYVMVVKNIRPSVAAMFAPDDIMYTDGGVAIGKIVGVRSADATVISQLADGTYTVGVIESKVDTYITVLADCSHSNGRYYANRAFELFVNQNAKYQTKYTAFQATMTEINPKS